MSLDITVWMECDILVHKEGKQKYCHTISIFTRIHYIDTEITRGRQIINVLEFVQRDIFVLLEPPPNSRIFVAGMI